MAKMTETEALALLAAGADALARLAVLIPTLVQNFQQIKDGLAADNADALNEKIVATHADVQALADQLEALRHA